MRPKALDSVFVASDSSLQRFTGAVSTNHDWEKPSCCRPWDEYSKHSLPQLFRFFPRFPSSIRQEIPLLVYLDPLDCIDARILKLSWFLVFIFIVLDIPIWLLILGFWSDTIWNGSLSLVCVSIGLLFTKLWRKNIDLPCCIVPPPPPPSPPLPFSSYSPFKTCYVQR